MGKKGKKAKGGASAGIPLTEEEKNLDLTLQIETLERELLVKIRIEENLRSNAMQLRDKVEQMADDYKSEQKTTYAVTSDMARQYKALQEDLIHKINALETTLTEQKEELDMTRHELRELNRDKDDIIAHKERIISELKSRTDQMCSEFHEMLNTTLKLMKDHMATKLSGNNSGGVDGGDGSTLAEQEKVMRSTQEQYAQKLLEYSNVGKMGFGSSSGAGGK